MYGGHGSLFGGNLTFKNIRHRERNSVNNLDIHLYIVRCWTKLFDQSLAALQEPVVDGVGVGNTIRQVNIMKCVSQVWVWPIQDSEKVAGRDEGDDSAQRIERAPNRYTGHGEDRTGFNRLSGEVVQYQVVGLNSDKETS